MSYRHPLCAGPYAIATATPLPLVPAKATLVSATRYGATVLPRRAAAEVTTAAVITDGRPRASWRTRRSTGGSRTPDCCVRMSARRFLVMIDRSSDRPSCGGVSGEGDAVEMSRTPSGRASIYARHSPSSRPRHARRRRPPHFDSYEQAIQRVVTGDHCPSRETAVLRPEDHAIRADGPAMRLSSANHSMNRIALRQGSATPSAHLLRECARRAQRHQQHKADERACEDGGCSGEHE